MEIVYDRWNESPELAVPPSVRRIKIRVLPPDDRIINRPQSLPFPKRARYETIVRIGCAEPWYDIHASIQPLSPPSPIEVKRGADLASFAEIRYQTAPIVLNNLQVPLALAFLPRNEHRQQEEDKKAFFYRKVSEQGPFYPGGPWELLPNDSFYDFSVHARLRFPTRCALAPALSRFVKLWPNDLERIAIEYD